MISVGNLNISNVLEIIQDVITTIKKAITQLAEEIAEEYSRIFTK